MAALINSLYDDFNLPAADSSKWQVPTVGANTTLTFPTNQGLVWTTTSGAGYSDLISRVPYNMQGGTVYVRQDAVFTTTSTVAVFEITRSADGSTGDLYRTQMVLYYVSSLSKWRIEARVYNTSGTNVGSSFLRGTVTADWNYTGMRYWRQVRNATTNRHYWQYSADAVTWITLAYADGMSQMTSVYVRFYYGNGAGTWKIRRINTLKDINRGTGFLSDDFRLYPQMTMPASSTKQQFGLWYHDTSNYTGGVGVGPATASVTQSLKTPTIGNNVAKLEAANVYRSGITSSTRSTIRDLDVSAKIRHQSGTSTRIKWRIGSDGDTYWYLHLTSTSAQLGYRISGTETSVGSPYTFSSILAEEHRWRVIHVGSEIVILSDVGVTTTTTGTTYGSGTYGGDTYGGGSGTIVSLPEGEMGELGRVTDSHILAPGNVGFDARTAVAYIDDVKVVNGVIPPSPIGSSPSEPVQIKPWDGDRYAQASQIEYMRLTDNLGNTLNIMPTYGDVELLSANLGSPETRSVVSNRSLANGARSFTRYHGSKNVSLQLRVFKTTNQEAMFWADLIQFWAAPGKQCTLYYKPRGGNERYITLEGAELGRPEVLANGKNFMDVDATWLAVDGGDYETATRETTLAPSTSVFAKNSGSLDTEPVIRIYGPCTNPVIYQETIEANFPGTFARLGLGTEDLPFVLEDGEFVELRYTDNKVLWMGWRDESASRRGDLSTRDWFVLKAGRNSLRLETDEQTGSAKIFWRDKY